MPPDSAPAGADWRAALVRLGALWAVLIAVALADWRAMVAQWLNSSTYEHVVLVPAILAWLVWQRRTQLAAIKPQGWWPGLAALALAALLWVLGRFAGLAEASELGAVLMLIGGVLAVLGVRVGAGLVFPLAYMVFLVPAGDELVPALQAITAALTIALLHLTHVRAVSDGVFITTPAGLFVIAEACSGVKFLVAMLAFGALAANLCFVGWRRRAVFLLACVVVPILANGVRAWGTVYVAQSMGAAYAGGVDHIIYGWVFFAVVIAAIIGGAWRWFDRPAGAAIVDADAINASLLLARVQGRAMPLAAVLGIAVALGAAGWVMAADRLEAAMPAQIALPEVVGWHRVDVAVNPAWSPRAAGAAHRLLGAYADGAGHRVDVFYALYAAQGSGRNAGAPGEGAVPEDGDWAWQGPAPSPPQARIDRLLAAGGHQRLAQTTFHSGSLTTGGNLALRLHTMQSRLLLRAQPTAMLIISAEEAPGHPAAAAIGAFRAAIAPLDRWLDQIARNS